jgi:hypothetical protein
MSNALIVTSFAEERWWFQYPTSQRRVIVGKSRKGGSLARGVDYPLSLIRALLALCR